MKKRIFAWMLALCLVLAMMPVPAFAEGEPEGVSPVCTCEAGCTAETMNTDCPVCAAEGATPESCGKYVAPKPEPTAAQKVQALIDALPETVTAENRAEVEAQLTAIDDAKAPLGDEERAALDFGKYDAAVAAINALDGMPGAEVPTVMDLQSELNSGGTVKLSADYTITTQITITNTVTLDLNGHVIKQEGNDRIFHIVGGHLTLTDSNSGATHEDTSLPAGGVLTGGKTSFNGGGISISSNGSFTMNGGTITNCEVSNGSKGGGVYLDPTSGGSFTMNGGTITSCKAASYGGGVFAGGSFTMNGGTIQKCSAVTHNDSNGVYVDSSGTFTMTGGTIRGNVDNRNGGKMYADGGVISGTFSGKIDRNGNAADYTTFSGKVNSSDEDISKNAKLVVTFNPQNGEVAFMQEVLKGQKASKPADPTRDGFMFTGWHERNIEGQHEENLYDFDTPVMNPTTLDAFWKRAYQVTYNPGTDATGTIDPDTKIEGEPLTLSSETFTRTGYTQSGWATTENGTKDYGLGAEYTANAALNLYPVWTANGYTVSFNANGGEGTMADLSMTYGKTANLTALGFTRTGYTFTGWNTQADGKGTAYGNEQSVRNLTTENGGKVILYAQWKINGYTISFHANGGEGTMADLPMTYDKAANLTANSFTRTGYTFAGWNTQADGTGTGYTDGQEVTNLTAEDQKTIDLYAQWKAHTYTISFHANGGEGTMADLPMTYGKTANLTALGFTREGYRFTGWTTKADGTGLLYADEETVSNLTSADGGTVDLYAQWVKVIDRVNLTLSGHVYDQSVEQVKVTTKDDILFPLDKYDDGWGIIKDPNKLTSLGGKLFQADTQYYLWVKFSAKEGCTLEGLKKENVFLDGKAALSLTDEQGAVTVVFRLPVIYTVEASAGKNGTISPEGRVAVFEGEDVEIKITPDKGYVVYRLTVDGKNVKTARTYTFENIQQSHTIKARFLKNGDNAKTGDSFPMATALGAVTISAAALAAALLISKKRRAR